MAQFGKKTSSKRSKPSYFMAILGVSLVLMLIGIMGWILINARSLTHVLKENVKVIVYLNETANQNDVQTLREYISGMPYTKESRYIDKETAKKEFISDGAEDFTSIIDNNPLPANIEFSVKSKYVVVDTIERIKTDLVSKSSTIIQEIKYPVSVVEKMERNVRYVITGIFILALVLGFLSILLIDNTIKLAMFSNRFLIKTMQMVGATRFFISRPFDKRAVINGAVSAGIAFLLLIGIIFVFDKITDGLLPYSMYSGSLWVLFAIMLILGIGITLVSTHRSVLKYLKLRLDELY
jgi:cell division transport system permease protein